jgi:hypothetical protein
MTNGHINKSFTRGVIHWLHGDHLDWVKYAVYCGKFVLELREMKATNVARHAKTSGVHEVKGLPRPLSAKHLKNESKVLNAQI